MSAVVRQALADAANTVEGLHVTPYFSQGSLRTGGGMVRKDRVDYPNPFGGVVRWQVVVVLPSDLASAEKYLDETVPQVVTAVREHLVVTDVTPAQLAIDAGTVPVALIHGHREED
jgi:hypothetical protein